MVALAEAAGTTWTEAEEATWRGALQVISETMLNGARSDVRMSLE